jgi:hypothetical protein
LILIQKTKSAVFPIHLWILSRNLFFRHNFVRLFSPAPAQMLGPPTSSLQPSPP